MAISWGPCVINLTVQRLDRLFADIGDPAEDMLNCVTNPFAARNSMGLYKCRIIPG